MSCHSSSNFADGTFTWKNLYEFLTWPYIVVHNFYHFDMLISIEHAYAYADEVANVGIVDLSQDHKYLWDIEKRKVHYRQRCPTGSREVSRVYEHFTLCYTPT